MLSCTVRLGRLSCVSWEVLLQLLFSAFPGGWPGISLLLMRGVLAIAMFTQGGAYLAQPDGTLTISALGAFALIAGGLLLIGLFTPFAILLVGLNIIGVPLSVFPAPAAHIFDSPPALVFALAMLVGILGVGPGRFSVDARMFGRREIIIPLPQSHLER